MMQRGTVLQLYISTGDPNNPREKKETLYVDPNGVKGDKFYAKNPNRSVLITSTKSYEIASDAGIALKKGVLGENIFIDIDPTELFPGDIIKIAQIPFEVRQNCTLCKGLSQIDSKLPKLLKEDRGIFIQAQSAGEIKVGDTVEFIQRKLS